jgi:hypothetical protein
MLRSSPLYSAETLDGKISALIGDRGPYLLMQVCRHPLLLRPLVIKGETKAVVRIVVVRA